MSVSPRRRAPLLAALVVPDTGGSATDILAELRRTILSAGVPPGSPIPVGDVATTFGVSAIPVREALKILQGEGLVQHSPRGGYAIAQLTAQELRELYIVRESLESAALGAAVAAASDSDLSVAAAVAEALDAAIRDEDPLAYNRLSRDFHMALTRPSRMLRLLHMLDGAWNLTEPIQPMVHVSAVHRRELHDDHRRMLAAFTARDEAALISAATEHNRRLNSVITTLPADLGLLAP